MRGQDDATTLLRPRTGALRSAAVFGGSDVEQPNVVVLAPCTASSNASPVRNRRMPKLQGLALRAGQLSARLFALNGAQRSARPNLSPRDGRMPLRRHGTLLSAFSHFVPVPRPGGGMKGRFLSTEMTAPARVSINRSLRCGACPLSGQGSSAFVPHGGIQVAWRSGALTDWRAGSWSKCLVRAPFVWISRRRRRVFPPWQTDC